MDQYLAELLEDIFYGRARETMEYFQVHKDKILQSFLVSIASNSAAVQPLIDSGKKGLIKYVQLSYLLSDSLVNELKVKIDFYDARYYGDIEMTGGHWDYKDLLLFPYIDEDMEIICCELLKRFTRLKNYELLDIRLYYHIGIFALMLEILKILAEDKAFTEAFFGGIFASEVTVLYGAYLDQSEVIASIKGK